MSNRYLCNFCLIRHTYGCLPEYGGATDAETMHDALANRIRLLEIEGVRVDEHLSRHKGLANDTGAEFVCVSLGCSSVRLRVCPSSEYQAVLYRDIVAVYSGNRVFVQGKLERVVAHCPRRPHIAIAEPCSLNCRSCAVPKMLVKAMSGAGAPQIARGSPENL